MILIYNLLYILLLLPAFLLVLIKYRKRVGVDGLGSLHERLGYWNYENKNTVTPVLWVHCASLGEVKAIEPLLPELKNYTIVISTLTTSGFDYASKKALSKHIYFAPLDISFLVNRVIRTIKPAALVLVETELWPATIAAAKNSGAKVLLVNARLSKKSFRYYFFSRLLWARVLKMIDMIAARSKEDADRLLQLGAQLNQIIITGNMKYDITIPIKTEKREAFGFKNEDRLIVFGSVRDSEFEIIIDLFEKLADNRIKFIVAPRHTEKINELVTFLKVKKLNYSLFTSGTQSSFMVVDKYGVLNNLYSICDIAVIGGSLVDKGGQNPIEPASYSKPVVFGPFMSNFMSEANLLLANGGAIKVNSKDDLLAKLKELSSNNLLADMIGKNAKIAVESQRGAVAKTKSIIENTFKTNE